VEQVSDKSVRRPRSLNAVTVTVSIVLALVLRSGKETEVKRLLAEFLQK